VLPDENDGARPSARCLKLGHESLNLGRGEEGTELGCLLAEGAYVQLTTINLHPASDGKTAAQSEKTGG
jgi:hypothetical protein